MKQKLLVQRYRDENRKPRNESIFDLLYTKDGKTVCLQYAKEGSWTSPGKDAAKINSGGNGFKIWLSRGPYQTPQEFYLDYSSADYLLVLLKLQRKFQNKTRPGVAQDDIIVSKLEDAEKPRKEKRPSLETINDTISKMDEEELMLVSEAVNQRFVDRGWQWGDILHNIYGWLRGHAPGAREEYLNGTHMEFFYGAPEIAPRIKK